MGSMWRAEESYHGDVANFDWPGAESLEQSGPQAGERKCGPCSPVERGQRKEKLYLKKKKGDIPCSKNHAVFQIQERLLFFHRVQRVRQGEGVHASAFEEHHASTSESCDTLTL